MTKIDKYLAELNRLINTNGDRPGYTLALTQMIELVNNKDGDWPEAQRIIDEMYRGVETELKIRPNQFAIDYRAGLVTGSINCRKIAGTFKKAG